jgi:DNA repair protein RecO
VEKDFTLMRKNLDALQNTFSNIKLIEKFTTWDDPDKKLFLLLQEYLESLEWIIANKKEEKIALLSLGFQFKLFDALGYLLEMDHCVHCNEKISSDKNYFDALQGGIVCTSCISRGKALLPASENAIKGIRLFRKSALKSLHKLSVQTGDLRNLERIAQHFLRSLD